MSSMTTQPELLSAAVVDMQSIGSAMAEPGQQRRDVHTFAAGT